MDDAMIQASINRTTSGVARMRALAVCLVAFFAILFSSVFCVLSAPMQALASSLTPVDSDNIWDQHYTSYSSNPVKSHLYETPSGMLERVEYADDKLIVEDYTKGYVLKSQKTIDASTYTPSTLSGSFCWGGFYAGSSYNFVVTGQTNIDESDTLPVVRITRYTKDWKLIDYTEAAAINTYAPFTAGSCRMLEFDGTLMIRTCHTMYQTGDGYHHQASMTFAVQADGAAGTLAITESLTEISNISGSQFAYVSHSFNQFLATDGTYVYSCDHGDAYPRSVCSKQIYPTGTWTYDTLFAISGDTGLNYTGVKLGGFECAGSTRVAVGVSVDQSDFENSTVRNVWFASSNGTTKWLTNLTEGIAMTPQMVKVNDNRFLIIWALKDDNTSSCEQAISYEFVDANGDALSKVYTVKKAAQSDCQPTVVDGKAVWYVTTNGSQDEYIHFYSIDLTTGEFARKAFVTQSHTHTEGTAVKENVVAATCTTAGSYEEVTYCTVCKAEASREKKTVAALGHDCTYTTLKEATCTVSGARSGKCARCGETLSEEIAALGHNWNTIYRTTDRYGNTKVLAVCSQCGLTTDYYTLCQGEFDAVVNFASRLYTKILDRDPDDEGLATQVAALRSGTAPAEIAYNYFAGAEYQAKGESASQTVERVYQVMFGRDSDAEGKAMWVGYLEDGMSVRAVIAGFSQSTEYKEYFSALGVDNQTIGVTEARDRNHGVTAFCGRLYTECLGRSFDASGINDQANAILNGMSASQVAVNFFTGAEFAGKGLSSSEIVERCYQTMMGRASDADGKAFWLAKMKAGMSVEGLVRGFAQSQEWTDICANYGVTK